MKAHETIYIRPHDWVVREFKERLTPSGIFK